MGRTSDSAVESEARASSDLRQRPFVYLAVLVGLSLIGLIVPFGLSGAAASEPEINPDGYTSARVCGECHTDIYDSWKQSLHAFSLVDPIFDTSYMQAVKAGGETARKICLRCHAPLTMMNGDFDLEEGVTREGVSCDFCHTVTAVHLQAQDNRYTLQPGTTKRGVIKHAASPAHDVAYSELHGTSEFCGGCHDYTTPAGARVLSTYEEWRTGPYASEGVQCQDCHMLLSAGKVVKEEIKETGDQIHLHRLIHDSDQVRGAISLSIVKAEHTSYGFRVEVLVENVGSGHMVPTGIPSREVVLNVTVKGATSSRDQKRRYRKVVADARGRVLHQDYEVLLSGARILNDTRIGPKEKRLETFTFDVPKQERVKVEATLAYKYSPVIVREQPLEIELGRAEHYAN